MLTELPPPLGELTPDPCVTAAQDLAIPRLAPDSGPSARWAGHPLATKAQQGGNPTKRLQ